MEDYENVSTYLSLSAQLQAIEWLAAKTPNGESMKQSVSGEEHDGDSRLVHKLNASFADIVEYLLHVCL